MKSVLFILVAVLVFASVLAGGYGSIIKEDDKSAVSGSSNPVKLIAGAINGPFNDLQLEKQQPTFNPSPTTIVHSPNPSASVYVPPVSHPSSSPETMPKDDSNICSVSAGDGGVEIGTCTCRDTILTCNNGQCESDGGTSSLGGHYDYGCNQYSDGFCATFNHGGTTTYCIGKPVIYLYPSKITKVDVSIHTIGQVVASDPNYPEGGWRDVTAYPNGDLFYQNSWYRELFYETNVAKLQPPKTGLIISSQNLKTDLINLTQKLGLLPEEQKEFLAWWLPRLSSLNSPYFLTSVLDNDQKIKVDSVSIKPEPDTFIDFIVYFKPMMTPTYILPLKLPDTPPQRVGFTAVEWGGVIDK